jgi:hypothetical protein
VKLLRGDFWYWVPLGGKAEILCSIVTRVVVKVVADFTSIVQLRQPNEVGGFHWAFGCVLTIASLPIATIISEHKAQENDHTSVAKAVNMYIIPLTLLFFAIFFWNIEKKYLGTFFSLQKGKDLTIYRFKNAETDKLKAKSAFENSKHHWISIEEEVRAWVEASWEKWEEEKPKWLDEGMKARIPVEYIPTAAGRRKERGRRESVVAKAEGDAGGVVRERRASLELGGSIVRVVPSSEEVN